MAAAIIPGGNYFGQQLFSSENYDTSHSYQNLKDTTKVLAEETLQKDRRVANLMCSNDRGGTQNASKENNDVRLFQLCAIHCCAVNFIYQPQYMLQSMHFEYSIFCHSGSESITLAQRAK